MQSRNKGNSVRIMQEYISENEDDTMEFAVKLASRLGKGSFIAVCGDLGAGKTAFAKGIAKGLRIDENIVSPTYTILRAYYGGSLPMYHFDVYRIGSDDELFETGFYEYAEGDGVCVCEWADKIADCLPDNRMEVRICCTGENQRQITVREVSS